MSGYITVSGESLSEYTEKRSRFIATVRHIETEEEAADFISEMRSKYWDARHNCYAYCLSNGIKRFSDDSEPHGTAGKPILEVIEGGGVTNVMIVVTRYFGGVLLGTGGLVRAYSTSSKDALAIAKKVEMIPCTAYKTNCGYNEHDKLLRLIKDNGGTVEGTYFTDEVTINYYFADKDTEAYLSRLCESFGARLTAKEIKKELLPIPLSEESI